MIRDIFQPTSMTTRSIALTIIALIARSPLHAQGSANAWVDKTLSRLTLERKVAQLVCPDITAGYVAEGDPRLERWISLARDHGVGMFVF